MGKMVLVGPKSVLQLQRSLDPLQHGKVKSWNKAEKGRSNTYRKMKLNLLYVP
jgi:hypothetical protein